MVSNLRKLDESDTGSDLVNPNLYRPVIGSLMYLIHLRLDICYVIITLSQCMSDLRHRHLVATKHVLRYLHGTIIYGVRYVSDKLY